MSEAPNKGTITFQCYRDEDPPTLVFWPDGRVFIRGELVDSNQKIYAEFKKWLNRASGNDLDCFLNIAKERDALRAALAKWNGHLPMCLAIVYGSRSSPCDCGYEAARKLLGEK